MAAAARLRFEDSFWGANDRGLDVLMSRLRAGKHITEEVQVLFKERAAIEEEYGKRLTKLAKTFNTREEGGTLRESLDSVRTELENSARAHLDVANEIRTQLEKPAAEFLAAQSAVRKNHSSVVERHLKAKAQLTQAVIKSKDRYERSCNEVEQLMANKPGLPAKDMEKMKIRLEKAQNQSRQLDLDYMTNVEKLQDAHRRWEEDFRTALQECQKLEEERIDQTRSYLWTFANMVSGVCVADDEACERVRASLEKCNVDSDIQSFIETSATGSEIPAPLRYVNFYTQTSERPLHVGSAINVTSNRFSSDRPQSITELPAFNSNTSNPAIAKSSSSPAFGLTSSSSSSPSSPPTAPKDVVAPNATSPGSPGQTGGSLGGGGGAAASFGRQGFNLFKGIRRGSAATNNTTSTSATGARDSFTPGGGAGGGKFGRGPAASYLSDAPTTSVMSVTDTAASASEFEGTDLYFEYDPYDFKEDAPILFQVRALYDYKAQAPEELSLARGQVVPVLATHDDGWWEGLATEDKRKRKGLFPSNFVEQVK